MLVSDFLKLGFTRWIEVHWSLAGTEEQAKHIFNKVGYQGKIYKMYYKKENKNNAGFFAFWMGIEK